MSEFQDGDFQDRVRRQAASGNSAMTTDPHLEADCAWLQSLRPTNLDLVKFKRKSAIEKDARIDRLIARAKENGAPIPMILHCPSCGLQHVDAPDPKGLDVLAEFDKTGWGGKWTNPPHRSHLCAGCGSIWRPADAPTEGVAEIKTKGKADRLAPASPVGGQDEYQDVGHEHGDGESFPARMARMAETERLAQIGRATESRATVGTREDEHLTPDEAWQQLLEVDDRTSPAEYPDHCLITKDELVFFMSQALASPAIEGWVMVPVEPTREMWAASGDAINKFGHKLKRHHDIYSTAVWKAMIAASIQGGE